MFTQFLETDNPDDYVYFVPREGGTRWIDNMAVVYDAQSPCTAHTFINFLLRADTGAALSNYNYYSTPNEAAFDGLDEELLDFVNDPNVIPGGGGLTGGDPRHGRLRDQLLRRLHRGQGVSPNHRLPGRGVPSRRPGRAGSTAYLTHSRHRNCPSKRRSPPVGGRCGVSGIRAAPRTKPAALKSPSNARASLMRSRRMISKLVAST